MAITYKGHSLSAYYMLGTWVKVLHALVHLSSQQPYNIRYFHYHYL